MEFFFSVGERVEGDQIYMGTRVKMVAHLLCYYKSLTAIRLTENKIATF